MSLAHDVAIVLLETDEIDLIDFYLGVTERIHIDGAGIRDAGRAIKEGRISVVADDSRISAHGDGKYEYGPNTMILSESFVFADTPENRAIPHIEIGGLIGTANQRGLIVHEAVHALLDINSRAVLSLTNEVAAYLAQVVFLHHYIGFWEALGEGGAEHIRNILIVAYEIARDQRLLKQRGLHVRWGDCRPLRKALKASPLYSGVGWLDRDWGNDGVPED